MGEQPKKGGFLESLGAVFIVGLVIWYFASSGASDSPPKWEPEIGKMALISNGNVACPTFDSIKGYINGSRSARAANDEIGAKQDAVAAALVGCFVPASQDALFIDTDEDSGIMYAKVRLFGKDHYGSAVWITFDALQQPKNTQN